MAEVLIRNVSPKTLAVLKARAKKNGRSLQSELADLLEREAAVTAKAAQVWQRAGEIRKLLAKRKHTDSAELIAKDRSR
jgi:plasmid stability protein